MLVSVRVRVPVYVSGFTEQQVYLLRFKLHFKVSKLENITFSFKFLNQIVLICLIQYPYWMNSKVSPKSLAYFTLKFIVFTLVFPYLNLE